MSELAYARVSGLSRQRGVRLLGAIGAIGASVVLGAITSLYVAPEFVVTVANQLWSCF